MGPSKSHSVGGGQASQRTWFWVSTAGLSTSPPSLGLPHPKIWIVFISFQLYHPLKIHLLYRKNKYWDELRWALFVTYTIIQRKTSSEMCSLHLTHPRAHTPGAADTAAPGEQFEIRCLAQGSHLSRGQFLPEPRFEPTTSNYKSNALSTRPRLPHITMI